MDIKTVHEATYRPFPNKKPKHHTFCRLIYLTAVILNRRPESPIVDHLPNKRALFEYYYVVMMKLLQ